MDKQDYRGVIIVAIICLTAYCSVSRLCSMGEATTWKEVEMLGTERSRENFQRLYEMERRLDNLTTQNAR